MGDFHDLVPDAEAIDPRETALVVIDITYFDAHPAYGFARSMERIGSDMSYYWDRVESLVVPNTKRLLDAWREVDGRVAFARVGGQLKDYGDSLCHLRPVHDEGNALRGSLDFEVREELAPRIGEIVVDKCGFGAFTTSNIDVLLRNAGVKSIVVTGVVTNACVMVSALGAYDLGYSVYVVEDACASTEEQYHDHGLAVMDWLGLKIVSTEQVANSVQQQSALVGG